MVLEEESELLRRVFGWDVPILAREWLELAVAGEWRFAQAPQEIRVWVVDGVPFVWSFHYMHVVENPKGFHLSHSRIVWSRSPTTSGTTIQSGSWQLFLVLSQRLRKDFSDHGLFYVGRLLGTPSLRKGAGGQVDHPRPNPPEVCGHDHGGREGAVRVRLCRSVRTRSK